MKRLALLLGLWLSACGPLPKPPNPQPPQPEPAPTTLAFDLVACSSPIADNYCSGPANATFKLHVATNPDVYVTIQGDGNGYVYVPKFPNIPDSDLTITVDGFDEFVTGIKPAELVANNDAGNHNFFSLKASHFDPSTLSLPQLAAIRGGMWPLTNDACGNLSIGPRPHQFTNVIATVFITEYSSDEQTCIINELKHRGYTHVVMGPLVDSDGYHGVWTPNDWRGANFEKFLDAAQKFWDNGLAPVVFIHPDGWSLDQTKNELTGLLQQPRARKLLRIVVPAGWEPAKYEWSSCTWAGYMQWARQTLPDALVLLHTVTDVDAPVGTDSLCDDNGKPNAEGWNRIVPYLHGWLTQSAAFADPNAHGDPNHPQNTNFDNWKDNFRCSVSYSYCNRFHNGYAGWPTFSAWGNRPIRIYAGEYAAYWKFWGGRSEAESVTWGDGAMNAGADGYLDSGSVIVPIRQ